MSSSYYDAIAHQSKHASVPSKPPDDHISSSSSILSPPGDTKKRMDEILSVKLRDARTRSITSQSVVMVREGWTRNSLGFCCKRQILTKARNGHALLENGTRRSKRLIARHRQTSRAEPNNFKKRFSKAHKALLAMVAPFAPQKSMIMHRL